MKNSNTILADYERDNFQTDSMELPTSIQLSNFPKETDSEPPVYFARISTNFLKNTILGEDNPQKNSYFLTLQEGESFDIVTLTLPIESLTNTQMDQQNLNLFGSTFYPQNSTSNISEEMAFKVLVSSNQGFELSQEHSSCFMDAIFISSLISAKAFDQFSWESIELEDQWQELSEPSLLLPPTNLNEVLLNNLEFVGVEIPDREGILNYIEKYPDIISIIDKISIQATQKFAEGKLSLEMFIDPNGKDYYPTLYVRLSEYPDNIMEEIENFSSRFYDSLSESSGWFLINTDFKPL